MNIDWMLLLVGFFVGFLFGHYILERKPKPETRNSNPPITSCPNCGGLLYWDYSGRVPIQYCRDCEIRKRRFIR